MALRQLFQDMVLKGASDICLRINASPRIRVDGKIDALRENAVTKEEMQAFTNLLLANEFRRKTFLERNDIDFVHQEEGVGRFRINIFMQRGTPVIVGRHVQTPRLVLRRGLAVHAAGLPVLDPNCACSGGPWAADGRAGAELPGSRLCPEPP